MTSNEYKAYLDRIETICQRNNINDDMPKSVFAKHVFRDKGIAFDMTPLSGEQKDSLEEEVQIISSAIVSAYQSGCDFEKAFEELLLDKEKQEFEELEIVDLEEEEKA